MVRWMEEWVMWRGRWAGPAGNGAAPRKSGVALDYSASGEEVISERG